MIHAENLAIALRIAIREQRRAERGAGYTRDSALVTGWEEALKELEKSNLTIKYN